MDTLRVKGLAAMLACAPLAAGCQFPGDGPSRLASQPVIDSGPSAQRLGPDGYPLVGAFPKAATTQLEDAAVTSERASLKAAAATNKRATGSTVGQYNRMMSDMQAIRKRQVAEVDAAMAAGKPPAAPVATVGQ